MLDIYLVSSTYGSVSFSFLGEISVVLAGLTVFPSD